MGVARCRHRRVRLGHARELVATVHHQRRRAFRGDERWLLSVNESPRWHEHHPRIPFYRRGRDFASGGAYDVDITSQTTITDANFGNHAASVSGTVFLDANQDGNLDPGDPGLGGWLVYDDENDDGAFDQPVESNIAVLDDPQPITPQSTTTSDISVSGQNGPIDDAVVTLSLDYPSDADLVITLTDPSGTTITLDNGVMTGQNMINTTFEDGGTALTAGAAPYTGTFQPSDLLASLDGDDPDGVWQLQVTDNGQTDSGTLEGWNLQLAAGNTDEPSAVTAADGSYQLNNLPEGVNIIREVPPAGYAETSPAGGFAAVTLTTGSYVTGINFGIDTAPPVVELGGPTGGRELRRHLVECGTGQHLRSRQRHNHRRI